MIDEDYGMISYSDYESAYNEASFWKKVLRVGRKVGLRIVEKALILYYTMKDDDTPKWAKTVIMGALGYFLSPIDFIPDLTPILGYSDDWVVLIAAISAVTLHIKDEHKLLALKKIKEWFE